MMNRQLMVQRIDPECMPLIHLINQILQGYGQFILICGKQRIGKSTTGLSLAYILTWILNNERFDVNKYVFFNALNFLKKTITVRRRVMIIDEASKDLTKSDWYTLLNQVLSKIIETQADLNNIFIVILPHASRLATQHKIYVNVKIVMERRGVANFFYMDQKYGEMSSDIKKIMKAKWIKKWKVPIPPQKLWDEYETLSEKRKREIAQEEVARIRQKKKDWMCLVCNNVNRGEEIFCNNCGTSR